MNSKGRIIAAIELRQPDHVPLDGYFRSDVWDNLRHLSHTQDLEKILCLYATAKNTKIEGPF